MSTSFYHGVAINLCGCVSVNGGTNLMKKGTMDKQRPVWYLGTAFFAGGNVLNFMSFSMAPQSFLASLSAVQFVSNVFFARCLLKEQITRRILFATLLIIVGILTAVRCASTEDVHYSPKEMFNNYRFSYSLYLLGQLGVLIVAQIIYQRSPEGPIAPICFAAVSAIIGTQSVVQAKCVAELMLHSRNRAALKAVKFVDPFWWFPWAVGAVLLFSQVFWLVRMQLALARFDGAVIIPLLQVFWTSLSILTGGLYFGEFRHFGWARGLIFVSGLCILFIGVFFLVPPEEEKMTGSTTAEDVHQKAVLARRASTFLGPGMLDICEFTKEEGQEDNPAVLPRFARQMLGVFGMHAPWRGREVAAMTFSAELARINERLSVQFEKSQSSGGESHRSSAPAVFSSATPCSTASSIRGTLLSPVQSSFRPRTDSSSIPASEQVQC